MAASHDTQLLRRVNLNLLYSLYAILNSESLSKAAEVVSLTQPAISQALKKLRAEFNDDLFYHEGGERRLTPLAEILKAQVERALQEASRTFTMRLEFNPATSTRAFTIAAPESILTMFLGPLVARLRHAAPHVTLSFVKLDNAEQMQPINAGVDLLVGPNAGSDTGENRELLYSDHLVCLAWTDNARFDDEIGMAELATADIVGGEGALLPRSLLADAISDVLKTRGFAVDTDSLASLPGVLVGTDLIALVPSWLAQYYAAFHPLKLISFPRALDEWMPVFAQWHPRHADDPAVAWLVAEILDAAKPFGAATYEAAQRRNGIIR